MLSLTARSRSVAVAAMTSLIGLSTNAVAENADISTSTVQGDQGALTVFAVDGEGMPVLFLHADPGNATQWVDVMSKISARHPVAAYDARGAGASEPAADGDYSFAARGVDLGLVADALGFDRFVIAAHSGAVAAAMTYSAAQPERVAGLFLLDPLSDPRALPAEEWIKTINGLRGPDGDDNFLGFVASIAGFDERVREKVLADAGEIAPDARAELTEAVSQWNPELAMRGNQAPIYLLTTPNNSGLAALWNLANTDHSVSRTTGHWIQMDDPALVVQELERFLDKIGDGS